MNPLRPIELPITLTLTPRVVKCVAAGSVENLFPVLADWSKEELAALVADLDAGYAEHAKLIDDVQPLPLRSFFKSELMIMFSEIFSVAQFYLEGSNDAETQ